MLLLLLHLLLHLQRQQLHQLQHVLTRIATVLLCLLLILQQAGGTTNDDPICSLCLDPRDTVGFPEKSISVPESPIPIETCAALEQVASLVPSEGTTDCQGMQVYYGILQCGCPIPNNACQLCSNLPEPLRELTTDVQMMLPSRFQDLIDHDQPFTCELFSAILATVSNNAGADNDDDGLCIKSDPVRRMCGCIIEEGEHDDNESTTTIEEQQTSSSSSCQVCSSAIPFKHVNLLGRRRASVLTCLDLEQEASKFASNSSQCHAIHHLMYKHCGCVQEDNPCMTTATASTTITCPQGYIPSAINDNHLNATTTKTTTTATTIDLSTHVGGGNTTTSTSFLYERVMNLTTSDNVTCAELEMISKTFTNNSVECMEAAHLMETACRSHHHNSTVCRRQQEGESALEENNNDNNNTTAGAGSMEGEEDQCSLCMLGEPVPFPNRTVDYVISLPDCATLDLAASLYKRNSRDCTDLQALGKACGCAVPSTVCSLCEGGVEHMTIPEAKFAWSKQGYVAHSVDVPEDMRYLLEVPTSCRVMDSQLAIFENANSNTCFAFQLRGASCGCPSRKANILLILKRICASLSLVGSLFILLDVLRDSKKYKTTYHQLLIGISAFDCVTSIAYWLGPAAVPAYSGIPRSYGNDNTCRALGFAIQLGLTSAYFNLGLSVYYWLVICHHWKVSTFRKIRAPFYFVLVVIGFCFAFGGLPYYSYGVNGCQIFPPPIALNWFPVIFFFLAPMSVVLLGMTLCTISVLLKVRQREKAMARYKTDLQRSQRGERTYTWTRRVFWKSFWYLAAVYLTFPVMFLTYTTSLGRDGFWLLILWSAFSPLQGFWNSCIYILYRGGPASSRRNSLLDGGGDRISEASSFFSRARQAWHSRNSDDPISGFSLAESPAPSKEFKRHQQQQHHQQHHHHHRVEDYLSPELNDDTIDDVLDTSSHEIFYNEDHPDYIYTLHYYGD